MSIQIKKFLRIVDVAKICRVSPHAVRTWVHKGWLPAVRTPGNGKILVKPAVLAAAIQKKDLIAELLTVLIQTFGNDEAEVARTVGMSLSSLRRILAGGPVSARAARKISRALGVPTSMVLIDKGAIKR